MLLLAAGCDPLRVDPGSDFAVALQDTSPIQATGLIAVPLRFRVTGCSRFDAEVTGSAGSHAIETKRDGEGWVAHVPVDWVRLEDGACLRGAGEAITSTARLEVTCADAGRTTSTAFEVTYATADHTVKHAFIRRDNTITRLYPTLDPVAPALLLQRVGYPQDWIGVNGPSWPGAGVLDYVEVGLVDSDRRQDPLIEARLLATEGGLWITFGGCLSGCAVEVAPGVVVPGEALNGVTAGSNLLYFAPGEIIDIAELEDGTLLVLSQDLTPFVTELGTPHPYAITYVSRIIPGVEGEGLTVIGRYVAEGPVTRLSQLPDGRFAFVSYTMPVDARPGPLSAVFNVTDGRSVERTSDATGGLEVGEHHGAGLTEMRPSLSPDGSALLLSPYWNGSLWLGPPGAPRSEWTPLEGATLSGDLDGSLGGAAWTPDAVAAWQGKPIDGYSDRPGRVEVFDRAPPHALRFRVDVVPVAGASAPTALHGVAAVGDHLVLTTTTGVRILDAQGRLVGGADPLPCGRRPTAVAIESGPGHAAVGVGETVLVFDLASLPPP